MPHSQVGLAIRSEQYFSSGITPVRVLLPSRVLPTALTVTQAMRITQPRAKKPSALVHTDYQFVIGQLTHGWGIEAAVLQLRPGQTRSGSLVAASSGCSVTSGANHCILPSSIGHTTVAAILPLPALPGCI
jgi:hypothetical protein